MLWREGLLRDTVNIEAKKYVNLVLAQPPLIPTVSLWKYIYSHSVPMEIYIYIKMVEQGKLTFIIHLDFGPSD